LFDPIAFGMGFCTFWVGGFFAMTGSLPAFQAGAAMPTRWLGGEATTEDVEKYLKAGRDYLDG
jgi:hypothetical protein